MPRPCRAAAVVALDVIEIDWSAGSVVRHFRILVARLKSVVLRNPQSAAIAARLKNRTALENRMSISTWKTISSNTSGARSRVHTKKGKLPSSKSELFVASQQIQRARNHSISGKRNQSDSVIWYQISPPPTSQSPTSFTPVVKKYIMHTLN